ncbi:MAG: polyamine aminopropyltransferase [Pyrinomonadaceae bacterium]|nr:polyamine aminopropyltransferase [Pyrinomonadaceae bacterium]
MKRAPLLFLNVFIIAICGLIYELLAGTLSSYVLGDSVTQFSIIIGTYLFAMGVGSYLSRFVDKNIANRFVEVELAVAVVGGFSAPLLFLTFANLSYFAIVLYGIVFIIGTLVGLEIPLLMRILKDELDFKDLVSRVLAFDYIGALVASLLFPIFFVPRLGLNRTSLLFGMLNAAVAIWGTWLLEPLLKKHITLLRVKGAIIIILLAIAFIKSDRLTTLAEDSLYVDNIIYSKSSHYQRIIVTKGKTGYALFLNGNLQFSSFDEYRYHEALVHPVFSVFRGQPKRVLVLGGGDGLALREIEKYPSVEYIQLVDLDPDMTNISNAVPALGELNHHSFQDPRVHVTNADAFVWLDTVDAEPFDVAVIDFPDPNNFALGKLYTTRFYNLLKKKIRPDSAIVVQTTSPLMARMSFWCIASTLEAAGYSVKPYYTTVPSFGVWGYALASLSPFDEPSKVRDGIETKFINAGMMPSMFEFPKDTERPNEPIEVNRLDNQALVRYYEEEWRRFEQY